jgi:hypothetical protein
LQKKVANKVRPDTVPILAGEAPMDCRQGVEAIPVERGRLTKSREKDIKFGDDVSPAEQELWLAMFKRCDVALGFGPEHL